MRAVAQDVWVSRRGVMDLTIERAMPSRTECWPGRAACGPGEGACDRIGAAWRSVGSRGVRRRRDVRLPTKDVVIYSSGVLTIESSRGPALARRAQLPSFACGRSGRTWRPLGLTCASRRWRKNCPRETELPSARRNLGRAAVILMKETHQALQRRGNPTSSAAKISVGYPKIGRRDEN